MDKTKEGFYWHVHHDFLVEWCYNYDERVEFISTFKRRSERATRLRLMQPVKGEVPEEVIKVAPVYAKAYEAYADAEEPMACRQAWHIWDKLGRVYDEALAAHAVVLEALHTQECGCSEWNGKRLMF